MDYEVYPFDNSSHELEPKIDDQYSAMAQYWTDKLLFEKMKQENQDLTKIIFSAFNPLVVKNYDLKTIAKFDNFNLLLGNELRKNRFESLDSSQPNFIKLLIETAKRSDMEINFIQGWFNRDLLKCKTWVENNVVMAIANRNSQPEQIWPLIVPINI